jgi:hypothetical protein
MNVYSKAPNQSIAAMTGILLRLQPSPVILATVIVETASGNALEIRQAENNFSHYRRKPVSTHQ